MNKNYQSDDSKRQEMIVRQSQMERTIEIFDMLKIVPDSMWEVIALHEILTEYILTGKYNRQRIVDFNDYIQKTRHRSIMDVFENKEN